MGQEKGILFSDTDYLEFIPLDFPQFEYSNEEKPGVYSVPIIEQPEENPIEFDMHLPERDRFCQFVLSQGKSDEYLQKGLEFYDSI